MRSRATLIKQHFAKSDKLKKRLPPTRDPDTSAIEPFSIVCSWLLGSGQRHGALLLSITGLEGVPSG